jgi:hypothetical protein
MTGKPRTVNVFRLRDTRYGWRSTDSCTYGGYGVAPAAGVVRPGGGGLASAIRIASRRPLARCERAMRGHPTPAASLCATSSLPEGAAWRLILVWVAGTMDGDPHDRCMARPSI